MQHNTVVMLLYQNVDDDSHQWQKTLYKKIGSKKGEGGESNVFDLEHSVKRVLAMSKVLHGLHMVSTINIVMKNTILLS